MDYDYNSNDEDEDDYYLSDEEAESIDGIEIDDSVALWVSSKAPSCKVITKESLLAAQTEDLLRVMGLFSVREHHARTLLVHYRWDVEKLTSVYVEKGKTRMFSEAGITMAVDLDPVEPHSTVMCNICMDHVPGTDVTLMDCGYCFCNECKHLFLVCGEFCRTNIKTVWHLKIVKETF